MAEDLDLNPIAHVRDFSPKCWHEKTRFRLFISHLAIEKDNAIRLKDCLVPYAVSGFVAHEDISPTVEWEREIERALYVMDAFIAMHTLGFKDSFWTQQEIGFAVARGVKIISLKMGEDPTGFIAKHQALARKNRRAEQIAQEVHSMLAADELTADKLSCARRDNPAKYEFNDYFSAVARARTMKTRR